MSHTSINTEAHRTKTGWHDWAHRWKLHLVTTVAAVRIPLGDRHYNTPEVRGICDRGVQVLVASRYGGYPHTDDGVEVRRDFHTLRSVHIEIFNVQFKAIFDMQGAVPTNGLGATQRFALGTVLVYQLLLWQRHEHGPDLRAGLRNCLKRDWSGALLALAR